MLVSCIFTCPKPNASLKICFGVLAQLKRITKVESEVDVRKGKTFEEKEMSPLVEITAQRFGLPKNQSPNTVTEGRESLKIEIQSYILSTLLRI